MDKLIELLSNHGTKFIGYFAMIAAGIAIADKDLVIRTLGPTASDWALLITGVLAAVRGHQSTAKEKAVDKAVSQIEQQRGFARVGLLVALAIFGVLFLGGCATTSGVEGASTGSSFSKRQTGAAAQLIVKVAAMKYIEQASLSDRGARAARVISVAKLIADTAKGEPVTMQRLAQLAAEQLPANLEASDRMLAMALISVAQSELEQRTGVGGLESDTLLKVAEVLEWISDAAGFYAPSS
jgi:hypothetical protein